jgi:hypothetical protein
MTKTNSWYMPVVRSINGVKYQIIELPFELKEAAVTFAKKRNREFPAGDQRVVPSKDRKWWGVYEKLTYGHIPEQHRNPTRGEKK